MKKAISTFALAMVLMAVGRMPIVIAQAQEGHIVQQGDTLWRLSGNYLGDPVRWGEVLGANPFLKQPGRQFKLPDGRIVILIKPGEILEGLDYLGVTAEPVPIEELKPAPAETGKVADANTQTALPQSEFGFDWLWAFLVILGLIAAYLIYSMIKSSLQASRERRKRQERERELRQDPVMSGPAMVPGGIPATDTGRLENFFEQQAIARYGERNPGVDRNMIRVTRVGPIEEGTISGEGLVGYLGGQWHPRRIETPLRAYQARYRFPDATEEVLQCLQACMNPVAYGGETYRGFTFTVGQAVVAPPEPPTPIPQPVPHPAIAVARIRAAAQEEGHSTVTVGDRVITVERGVHFTVSDDGSITMAGTAFEMTVRPAQRIQANQPQRVAGDAQ